MSKLDNHIYLIICEITYEQFKRSKFQTYINYANSIKTGLTSENIGGKQKREISSVINILKRVLGLDVNTASEYVACFYFDNKFQKFEPIVVEQGNDGLSFKWLDTLY
jgi:hypothetical protein